MVGYLEDEAILEPSAGLGLMLETIALVRVCEETGGTAEEHQEGLDELGVFARLYHFVASKSRPARIESCPKTRPRIFRVPGFTGRDDTTH